MNFERIRTLSIMKMLDADVLNVNAQIDSFLTQNRKKKHIKIHLKNERQRTKLPSNLVARIRAEE